MQREDLSLLGFSEQGVRFNIRIGVHHDQTEKAVRRRIQTQAVALAQQLGSATKAAIDLGIPPINVVRWVKQSQQRGSQGKPAFTGQGIEALLDSEQRIKDLKQENAILR